MKTHYVIPFFIVHKGCPYQCVFCDQKKITGRLDHGDLDIPGTIEKHLSTISSGDVSVEVGFFGGTFTGLTGDEQAALLDKVEPFIKNGRVHGIRLSTRPDLITSDDLVMLKSHNVKSIELGVQSMSEKVLAKVKRGYTAETVRAASRLIKQNGFRLGHQMMVGLPDSFMEDEMLTAREAAALGADEVRIYPSIVIDNTELADWWRRGEYVPLSEQEAVARCVKLLLFFEKNGIKVLRVGLHPSESLSADGGYLAGPFHPAFRQKVESRIFGLMLEEALNSGDNVREVLYSPEDEAVVFGFNGENSEKIKKLTGKNGVTIKKSSDVRRGTIIMRTESGAITIDKISIAGKIL
ncbi:MAG TPA: radical SAM protein [Candidatus Omnitrophota bacterium]|nr:radical SAM protein [Candidatus Omnitrophota bacterium]HPS20999.1 radical SAM protein [Candidatus Omnitrophota bacterium]